MNYGLYLSASGLLTSLYRQDVYANNLANASTVGFKPDVPIVSQRAPEAEEEGFGGELRQRLLDKLGGGVVATRQDVSFTVGQLTRTNNDMDVALPQEHQFLAVQRTTEDGDGDALLTRDGRLGLDAQGYLIQIATGRRVLGAGGQPIAVDATRPLTIDPDGHLRQGAGSVGQLQVVEVAEPRGLEKRGENLFEAGAAASAKPLSAVAGTTLTVGYVEQSGVDPIRAMMDLIEATKAVTTNGNLIRYHDQLLDRAVNVLGRVVA